jgi:hypothetical protein
MPTLKGRKGYCRQEIVPNGGILKEVYDIKTKQRVEIYVKSIMCGDSLNLKKVRADKKEMALTY